MSKFTPSVSFETEFEGDKVSLSLRRLKRKDMMKVASMTTIDVDGNMTGGMNIDQMLDFAAEILPNYVSGLTGLFDADGQPITVETMIEEAYFISLVSEIVTKLFSISGMDASTEKNFEKQPDMLSSGPGSLPGSTLPDSLVMSGSD